MPQRLTEAAVADLNPRERTFIEYDTEVRKLGVRVTQPAPDPGSMNIAPVAAVGPQSDA